MNALVYLCYRAASQCTYLSVVGRNVKNPLSPQWYSCPAHHAKNLQEALGMRSRTLSLGLNLWGCTGQLYGWLCSAWVLCMCSWTTGPTRLIHSCISNTYCTTERHDNSCSSQASLVKSSMSLDCCPMSSLKEENHVEAYSILWMVSRMWGKGRSQL